MQEYFKEVEEESIRDNFVICYELLDELVDFGYPQTTDAKILQEYITQVGVTFTLTYIILWIPICGSSSGSASSLDTMERTYNKLNQDH